MSEESEQRTLILVRALGVSRPYQLACNETALPQRQAHHCFPKYFEIDQEFAVALTISLEGPRDGANVVVIKSHD
jgi:hypothetical protein